MLCGTSKDTFEIPHKISYPYIERYDIYTVLKFSELLDLRAHECFWNTPQISWDITARLYDILASDWWRVVIKKIMAWQSYLSQDIWFQKENSSLLFIARTFGLLTMYKLH